MKLSFDHNLGYFYNSLYAIYVVGGLLLVVGLHTPKYKNASSWLRKDLWFASLLVISKGLLGFGYQCGYSHYSPQLRAFLVNIGTMCGGGALALLVLLLCTGEVWRLEFAHRKRSTPPG